MQSDSKGVFFIRDGSETSNDHGDHEEEGEEDDEECDQDEGDEEAAFCGAVLSQGTWSFN